jgi:hypothetical protein
MWTSCGQRTTQKWQDTHIQMCIKARSGGRSAGTPRGVAAPGRHWRAARHDPQDPLGDGARVLRRTIGWPAECLEAE